MPQLVQAGRRVIALGSRGLGDSERPTPGYGMQTAASEIHGPVFASTPLRAPCALRCPAIAINSANRDRPKTDNAPSASSGSRCWPLAHSLRCRRDADRDDEAGRRRCAWRGIECLRALHAGRSATHGCTTHYRIHELAMLQMARRLHQSAMQSRHVRFRFTRQVACWDLSAQLRPLS